MISSAKKIIMSIFNKNLIRIIRKKKIIFHTSNNLIWISYMFGKMRQDKYWGHFRFFIEFSRDASSFNNGKVNSECNFEELEY